MATVMAIHDIDWLRIRISLPSDTEWGLWKQYTDVCVKRRPSKKPTFAFATMVMRQWVVGGSLPYPKNSSGWMRRRILSIYIPRRAKDHAYGPIRTGNAIAVTIVKMKLLYGWEILQ